MQLFFISIILIFINYGFILGAFKFFGKVGLFASIPIVLIMANIQVSLQIDFFTMVLTLGNVAYASCYLITDLLGELYSKQDAKKGVHIGFYTMIFVTVTMNIVLLYSPTLNPDAIANQSNEFFDAVSMIFNFMPRIIIASLTSYIVSQSVDVVLFHWLKKRFNSQKLWLRNNVSTILSQIIDNFIFTFLAFTSLSPLHFIFGGSLPLNICIDIFITTFIVKSIISLVDTPFVYLGVYLKKNNKITEI